jgi:hypothetical protein
MPNGKKIPMSGISWNSRWSTAATRRRDRPGILFSLPRVSLVQFPFSIKVHEIEKHVLLFAFFFEIDLHMPIISLAFDRSGYLAVF